MATENKIDINYNYVVNKFPDAIHYLRKSFKYNDIISVDEDDFMCAKFTLQWLSLPQNRIFWYIETELYNIRHNWTPTLPSSSCPNEILSIIR